jgi:hypothetical protein
VVEVDQDVQAHPHDVVRGDVLEVGHETDAARVVLEARVVESHVRLRVVHRRVLRGGWPARGLA